MSLASGGVSGRTSTTTRDRARNILEAFPAREHLHALQPYEGAAPSPPPDSQGRPREASSLPITPRPITPTGQALRQRQGMRPPVPLRCCWLRIRRAGGAGNASRRTSRTRPSAPAMPAPSKPYHSGSYAGTPGLDNATSTPAPSTRIAFRFGSPASSPGIRAAIPVHNECHRAARCPARSGSAFAGHRPRECLAPRLRRLGVTAEKDGHDKSPLAIRPDAKVPAHCRQTKTGGEMSKLYAAPQRAFQDRFDTRRIADAAEQIIVHPQVSRRRKSLHREPRHVLPGDGGCRGFPTCSYKGGDPGFVNVVDAAPSPSRATTATACSTPWATSRGQPRSACCSSTSRRRTACACTARPRVDANDPLMMDYAEADLVVRVQVEEIFVNCPRYVHRYRKVTASQVRTARRLRNAAA